MIYFVYIYHIHLFHGNISIPNWPAPNISGFIAQLVRASHRYAPGRGFKPRWSNTFLTQLRKLCKLRSQLRGSFFIWLHFVFDKFAVFENLNNGNILLFKQWDRCSLASNANSTYRLKKKYFLKGFTSKTSFKQNHWIKLLEQHILKNRKIFDLVLAG